MLIKFDEFLFESAPRIPNSEDYWTKKGKTGKNVCLILHDDMDGIVSAIIMKNYLIKHGFNIVKYGIVNYNESWTAFKLDPKLINIAVDFAEDSPDIDVYIDHHGKFSEELRATQKKHSIKTATGSAAEGIAQQLGVSFSNDTKNWIDMIDSAKYNEYEIDIRDILDFNLDKIKKSSEDVKLKFAAAFNQLLKRSDHKTFIEVVNASDQPSIYNIYRLFKIFYPKNNPDWKSGNEPGFVDDARIRLAMMQKKTKGEGTRQQGYQDGKKIRYMSQKDFWNDFSVNLPYVEFDDDGNPIKEEDPTSPGNFKRQVKPGVYQIIGNLMYVPSGTWANALRAKAIFSQDVDKGIIPDDPKLNFVLLQYGNTLQLADLRVGIKNMDWTDLPEDKWGNPIDNFDHYTKNLVENFRTYLGYPTEEEDPRLKAGGHWGIVSISNIFCKCKKKPYEGIKFLDLFKNKIINDISGVEWSLVMPWNEVEETNKTVKPDEVNLKLLNKKDIRDEKEALTEKEEREILNYLIDYDIDDKKFLSKFKDSTIKKVYQIWLDTGFSEIINGTIKPNDIDGLYFKKNKKIEDTQIFKKIVDKFELNQIYNPEAIAARPTQRKELKRIFRIIFNMVKDKKYINKDTESKAKNWIKNKII